MNKSIIKYISHVLKFTLVLLAVWLIKGKLEQENQLFSMLGIWKSKLSSHPLPLVFLLILMPINWGIETIKWKRLSSNHHNISIIESFKSVITGLGLSIFVGQHIGQLLGRSASFKSGKKLKSWNIVMANQISQTLITAGVGFVAFLYFIKDEVYFKPFIYTSFFIISTIIILLIIIPKSTRINAFISRKKHLYAQIPIPIFIESIIWSLIRYGVFTFQFYLVLTVFENHVPAFETFTAIALIFLFKTIIPTFSALGDLGTREFSAIYIFEQYQLSASIVVMASLTLWIINILLPSLVGIVFGLKLISLKKSN